MKPNFILALALLLGSASCVNRPSEMPKGQSEKSSGGALPSQNDRDRAIRKLKAQIALYQLYIRMRDGIPPLSISKQELVKQVGKYVASMQSIFNSDAEIAATNGRTCTRFLTAYERINSDLLASLQNALKTTEPNQFTLLRARAQILTSFEGALTKFALQDAEAGQSRFEKEGDEACIVADRSSWKKSLWKNHMIASHLLVSIFGQQGLTDPKPLSSLLLPLSQNQQEDRNHANNLVEFGYWFVFGTILWDLVVHRGIGRFIAEKGFGKGTAFLTRIAANGGLLGAMVVFDDYLRYWLGIDDSELKQPPFTFDEWDTVLEQVENFTSTPIESPTLYLRYVEGMERTTKQNVLILLQRYEKPLREAEEKWGLIDNALEHDKLELCRLSGNTFCNDDAKKEARL